MAMGNTAHHSAFMLTRGLPAACRCKSPTNMRVLLVWNPGGYCVHFWYNRAHQCHLATRTNMECYSSTSPADCNPVGRSPPLFLSLFSRFTRYNVCPSFGALQDKYIYREVQTLSLTAHHPHVISIHGFLSTASSTFVIMPLVKTDLGRLIQVPACRLVCVLIRFIWGVVAYQG